jgi:hypothetical protein
MPHPQKTDSAVARVTATVFKVRDALIYIHFGVLMPKRSESRSLRRRLCRD